MKKYLHHSRSILPAPRAFARLAPFAMSVTLLLAVCPFEAKAEAAIKTVTGEVNHFLAESQPQMSVAELTIDPALQKILEEELAASQRALKAESTLGIIVDPQTGEILAMAHTSKFAVPLPEFGYLLEPGSPFKIVAVSAALNEGAVTPQTKVDCEKGNFSYGGYILHDWYSFGLLTPREILKKSSDIGSAKLAILLGQDKFYEYIRRFGFGQRSGVEVPHESPGLLLPPKRWTNFTIASMSMGQEFAATPLQMAMAMSVIANGGKLMRPHVVRSYRDANTGKKIAVQPEMVRRVITAKTARTVAEALSETTKTPRTAAEALTENLAEGGLSSLAKVPGFMAAGLPGTTQKVDPKGGYYENRYVASFIGFLPVEKPALVCCIWVDDAKVPGNDGELIAAPIFSRVAGKAAIHLKLHSAGSHRDF
jgi:cell division protein FtsI/penicillin-binding protein 2